MSWFSRWRARDRRRDELNDELEFHLAMREEWNVEQGMSGDAARRSARLRFGNP
jgi:hypothetical protein